MNNNARKQTTKLVAAMDDGSVSPEAVANACLSCMSEAQVADMVRVEELLPFENYEDEEA